MVDADTPGEAIDLAVGGVAEILDRLGHAHTLYEVVVVRGWRDERDWRLTSAAQPVDVSATTPVAAAGRVHASDPPVEGATWRVRSTLPIAATHEESSSLDAPIERELRTRGFLAAMHWDSNPPVDALSPVIIVDAERPGEAVRVVLAHLTEILGRLRVVFEVQEISVTTATLPERSRTIDPPLETDDGG